MAVTFVLGRAGAGKTRYCVDAVLAELDRSVSDHPLVLLVPEQASLQMERLLATRARRGGYVRAAVLSFSRLAHRVLGAGPAPPLEVRAEARTMALRLATQRAGGALRYYDRSTRNPGFYPQLNRLLEELLHGQIGPGELERAGEAAPDPWLRCKLPDLAAVYRAYLDWLGAERIDPAARLAAVRERLSRLPWVQAASIWVDGFAGFTGQEQATLVELAKTARDVTVTLLVDPAAPAVRDAQHTPDPLDLFHRTEQTYQRLRSAFSTAGIELATPVLLHPSPLPRFRDAPELATLEAALAGAAPEPSARLAGSVAARIVECETHRDELRQAARFIRAQIADSHGQLRFRDFAVIARNLEPLAPLVAEVFAEYELPYFLDRRRPMRAHPVSRLLGALFEAIADDFSWRAAARLLHTGLLPLSRTEAEELENVAVANAVCGGEVWRRPVWSFHDEVLRGPHDEERRARRPLTTERPTSLDAARLSVMDAVDPLMRLAQADPPPTGAAWARTVHAVLEALGVPGRIERWIADSREEHAWERAETHRLAWEALLGALESLHEVLGESRLGTDEVAALLGAALGEQTLGLAPPTLDQVLVSAIERSRHPDIKYAWIVAFNEGIFPARPAEDELLTADERDALAGLGLLGVASRRDDAFDERLLAYIALTRPSHGLMISYATAGADGAPLLPSPLLEHVRAVLPGLEVRRADESAPPVCLAELARHYLDQCGRGPPASAAARRHQRLRDAVRKRLSQRARLDWLLRGQQYVNGAESVGCYRPTGAADVAWDGSPSEAETYLDCPFKHLATHGLRLDPERGPRPVSWDLGEAAHAILAAVTRRALREPEGVRTMPDERWDVLLEEAVAEFRDSWPDDLPQRRADLAFLAGRLPTFLREVVLAHAARWRRGQFEVFACEQVFGGDPGEDVWPAVTCTTPDRRAIRIRGKIDRVDRCEVGGRTLVLVYDYKTRPAPLAGEFLAGARLQLFSYLLAARGAKTAGRHVEPGGALLAPLYPDSRVLETNYARSAPETEQRMYLYRPRGLFLRDAACLLDTQLGTTSSPVVAVRLKQDGDFDRSASRGLLEPAELAARLELAERTLRQAAEGIAVGRVEPAPLVEAHTMACTRCGFRPLCRFDRAINRARSAESVLPTLARSAGDKRAGEDRGPAGAAS